MEQSESPEERRVSQRKAVDIACDVRIGSTLWVLEDLTDLTPDGFRMRRSPMCGDGAKVWIRISGLAPQSATIRWMASKYVGCSFNTPLAEYVFDHIIRQSEQG